MGTIFTDVMVWKNNYNMTTPVTIAKLFALTEYSQLTSHLEVTNWAKEVLQTDKYEIIVETPWSKVLKFSTPKRQFFLKQTPKDLFLEAAIIKTLRDACKVTDIPEIFAENKHLSCFLMPKCGDISLRDY